MTTTLEKILPLVTKPYRYQGLEFNSYQKNKEQVDATVALCFPDVYEIGMSHLGSHILYHVINQKYNYLAERSYAPWIDMEEKMQEENIPLFTLESHSSVKEFAIVGFTLQYELSYTNILNMLDLAGIPVFTAERTQKDPLIIAGGPCASNPEPLSPFIDAFIIGDGEEIILEICGLVKKAKKGNWDREKLLRELTEIEGIYVPSFYEYKEGAVFPKTPEIKSTIKRRFIRELKKQDFPYPPLVPIGSVVHDRLMIEIMRGCTRGCRFCHAGFYYRPVRERDPEEIMKLADKGIKSSGWDEISLVSLSTSDYSQIEPLASKLAQQLSEKNVGISLPSLRMDSLSVGLANSVQQNKSMSMTFAPEAGTQRLRDVINKCVTDEDFESTIKAAFSQGCKGVKLYFMIGLPTETMEDIEGIAEMIERTARIAKKFDKYRTVNVTISPFTPKPHTPFQWEKRESNEALQEKIDFLRSKIKNKFVDIKWHDLDESYLEAVFARGDRNIADVLYSAWKSGCTFDGWSDQFRFDLWQEAFQKHGIDEKIYLSEIPEDQPLPWDHIDVLVTKEFFRKEREKAYRTETTEDCREICWNCGVSPGGKARKIAEEATLKDLDTSDEDDYGRSKIRLNKLKSARQIMRIKFMISEKYRFISHLDFIRLFTKALSKAKLPIVYSQGYSPRPRISFGPPLPLGIIGKEEYLDLQLKYPINNLISKLNMYLPEGIEVLEEVKIFSQTPSLAASIVAAQYGVFDVEQIITKTIAELLARKEIVVERESKRGVKEIDIKPFIYELNLDEEENRLDMLLAIGGGGNARPTEVLQALFEIESIDREVLTFKIARTGLFVREGNKFITPMNVV